MLNDDKRSEVNVSILLKRFMSYAKQTNIEFRIEPLNGSYQSITNPCNITTTEEGVELYYQHLIIGDGVREKINISMSTTLSDMKYLGTPFRKYLNKEKVYVYQASLGLVDTRIVRVMLHTDPQLTFRDDVKYSIFNIMHDDTPISVFTKRVREVNAKTDKPKFTNGLAIQIAIKDGKETEIYTDKISKEMEFMNEHINHPILLQCVFVPFGRGAAIDPDAFCSFIRMQDAFCITSVT
jgi:hypothetical protein